MRKVKLNLCTSLDGFIEGEKGEIDWCFTDQDYGMTEFLASIDTIFIGRKSYEVLQKLSPGAFNDKKMVVFSRDRSCTYGDELISESILERVNDLKDSEGKDIWLFGGAELTTSFIEAGLLDEMFIAVHPLVLGKGKPLFTKSLDPKLMKLQNVKTYSSGLVQHHYSLK